MPAVAAVLHCISRCLAKVSVCVCVCVHAADACTLVCVCLMLSDNPAMG